MQILRFQHVFILLMGLALLSAFVVPARYTDKATPQVQVLFAPVARPSRAIVSAIEERMHPPQAIDLRPSDVVREENEQLVQENIKLRYDLEELARKNAEREKLGSIRELCTPVAVLGGDAGQHDSLAVQGSSLGGLKDGMFVLYAGGIVGTLQRAGVAGGQVQLVTDTRAKPIAGYFSGIRRIEIKADPNDPASKTVVELQARALNKDQPVLVRGAGKGMMVCSDHVTKADKDKMGLQINDRVIADDPDLPKELRGRQIGRVTAITPDLAHPLFVKIDIAPTADLLKLREVMVLTSGK